MARPLRIEYFIKEALGRLKEGVINRKETAHRRTFIRTECPGKNRKRGQQKRCTVEDMPVVIEDTD